MKSSKISALLVLGLWSSQSIGVAGPPSAAAEGDHTLVGRWRSLESSQGGIGGLFTFHADGSLEFSPGVVLLSKYRVEGDRLIGPPGTVNGPETVQVIQSLTPSTLRVSSNQSWTMELTRQGKPEDPHQALVGVWTVKGSEEARQWEFHSDGTLLVSSGPKSYQGRYTREGDQIRMRLEGAPAREAKLRWEGDVPVLRFEAPPMEMTREGQPADPKNLLLGTWAWVVKNMETGNSTVIRWQFRANGTRLMTAGFRTDKGRYTVQGEHIRLEIDGYPAVEGRFGWEEDVLILPGPRGTGQSRFERY